MEYFRNLQVRDPEFVRKKEKILWPLLQLPLNNNLTKGGAKTGNRNNKAPPSENKLGKNTELLNKLN